MLAPYFRPRRFPAGSVLWRDGETPSMVVAIETGHIKVYRTLPGGNVAALYLFGPGELFGFLPFLDGRPYPATAEAVDDVRARTMSREGLLRALRITPESFSRAVTGLAEAGMIHRLGRGRFQVLDPPALRGAASPGNL